MRKNPNDPFDPVNTAENSRLRKNRKRRRARIGLLGDGTFGTQRGCTRRQWVSFRRWARKAKKRLSQ